MTYILDTDVLTIGELPDSPAYARLHARVLHLADDDRIATMIVTDEEQTRGWLAYMAKARDVRHQVRAYDRLKRHLLTTYATLDVLDFDDAAAADVFAGLVRRKLGVGSSDLKIAAIVLARGAVLLSRNLTDFRKVPGLTVDDWTGE